MFQSKGDTRSNLSRMESCLPRPHCRWHRIVWRSQRQHTRWVEEVEEVEETRNCFLQQAGSLVLYSLKNSSWPEMSLRLPTGSPFCKKGVVMWSLEQFSHKLFPFDWLLYRDISLLAKSNQSLIIKNHNLTTIMVKSHDLSFSLLEFPPSSPTHACGEIETLKELFFLSNPNPRSGFPAEPSSFSTCRKTGLVSLSTLDLNEWT